MSKINEGQTQVYMNGGIYPQVGINTHVHHLNDPSQQLLDLISQFKRSEKTDAQILAILVGMGVDQQLAMSGINRFNDINSNTININMTEKNNMKMNFTLIDLYEKINSTIEELNEMITNKSKISYSAENALSVLKKSFDHFPSVKFDDLVDNNLQNESGDSLADCNEETFSKIKTVFENHSSPLLKFKIAKQLYADISKFNWLNPVNELKTYLDDIYIGNKWAFKISEVANLISKQNNPLYEKLQKDLLDLLKESDIVAGFKTIAKNNLWSSEISSILNEMNIEENKSVNQKGAIVNRVFSPILNENGGIYFNLHGRDYFIKDSKITESSVSDIRYRTILDTLSFASIGEDNITWYGQNDKFLRYNINDNSLKLGNLDLSESNISNVRNAILTNQLFHFAEVNKVDKLCITLENLDMVTEMDNILDISSITNPALFLTLISVEEGVWVNKINTALKINEMIFHESAESALNETKNFIGYDATSYLSEMLVIEGNRKAIIEKTRAEINKRISVLEEKKADINNAIKTLGESTELIEALDIVNGELKLAELDLQKTYGVSEAKLSQSEIDEFADDGYVEAVLKKNLNSKFKKGMQIMVNAEEYSSLGKGDLLKIINPKTGENSLVDKGDLIVDFQ